MVACTLCSRMRAKYTFSDYCYTMLLVQPLSKICVPLTATYVPLFKKHAYVAAF